MFPARCPQALHEYNCLQLRYTLPQVRAQLAPWEKRMGEVSSRISVATSERDLLAKKADDARRKLEVSPPVVGALGYSACQWLQRA